MGQTVPVALKLLTEFLGDSGRASASPIIRDPDPSRVLDHASTVEAGKFDGDTAGKMPCAVTTGEEVGHPRRWTKCWTDCWTNPRSSALQKSRGMLGSPDLPAIIRKLLERAKGFEPSTPTLAR